MQNIFLKKEKASLSYKILSFFFVFSLILSSFAPSLVIAQEVVAEAEQQVVEEQKVVEQTVVEEAVAEEIVPEVASDARTGLEIVAPETCSYDMSVSSQGNEDGSELIDGGPAKAVTTWGPMSIWALITGTNWIWSSNHVANPTQDETKTISKWFSVPGPVISANLQVFADNSYKVSVNSNSNVYQDLLENNYMVGSGNGVPGNGGDNYAVDPVYFNEGGNTIHFEVKNFGQEDGTWESNPAGVDFKLDITYTAPCGEEELVSTITVTKVVAGGDAQVSDFPLFVDETPVDSGEENQFAPGTYTIHEDGDENYIPKFSGACVEDFNNANRINMIHDWVEKRNALMIAHPNSPNIADINAKIDALLNSITATITLGEDENAECTITNTYTDHTTEYGAYCGDGNIDTSLGETCDGGESCTDQCQGANVCSEKAFARVVVPAGSSHIKNFGNGNMTSDVFLGGNTIGSKIPNGTWFMIHDGTNWITDSEALNPNVGAYEDVPGFAVQRGANFVRLSMYSSSPKTVPTTKEHADGWLEFFNIDTTGLSQVSDGDDNIVEKSNDTLKDYTPGQDELSVSDGKSNFWLTVGPEDDSFKTTFENRVISECDEQNPVCNPEENLVKNGSFETPTFDGAWTVFQSGTPTLEWLANWINPIGAPAIANIEIQKNGLMGVTANGGNQWAELDSDWNAEGANSGSTKIYQNITTVPGQKYKLMFAHAPRPNTSADENKLRVDWDNTLLAQLDMGIGGEAVTWTPETYTNLTATTTSTQVAFSDAGISNSVGTYLDSVEVYCVPEDNNNGGETCEENPDQEKCNENPGGGGNGGGNGGSSRSGSRPTGSVLGDSTTDLPGQVLGATLAQTGTDASPMLVLGATILGLLFITRRKAFKFN